jgi:hypothetical protein
VKALLSRVGRVRRGLVDALALVALTSAGALVHAAEPDAAVWVGRFADGLDPWREVQLNAKLAPNRFVVRDWDGVAALEVRSERSMSLMARPLSIDLAATPVLCWRWRIDAPLAKADLATRAGDDYAARVYVTLSIPVAEQGFALRAKLKLARAFWGGDLPDAALNYVWDNRRPIGTEAPNAYTDRTMMIVQRSGSADAQRWVWERRDVGRDAARLFGASARAVQLAVTADTDNTGETAHAGFADLHFVPADMPCVGAS